MLVGAVLVITSVGYIIFRLVKQPVGQSLLEILGWGLVANLLASAIAFGIARFRDNYPEKKQKIEERHRATLIEQAQSTLDDVGRMHKFSILEESVLSQKLAQIYNSLVNPQADSWQASVEEQYRRIRGWVAKYNQIRRDYLNAVDSLTKNSGKYFEDAQQNLATLRSIAESIKESAIEPSFKLLARTSEDLGKVKNELSAIRFT